MVLLVAALLSTSLTFQVRVETERKDSIQKKTSVTVSIGEGERRRRATLTIVGDSTDSSVVAEQARGRRRVARRQPVTAQVLATAFRDPTARVLLERARVARLAQDSALLSYDATAYQRISAGMGFAKIGRDRLIFRTENVSRVRWQRGVGAYVDLKGQRTVIPVAPKEAQAEAEADIADDADMTPVPYYPGYEQLWIGMGRAKRQVDEREFVHPLAVGAEAYYYYESGDSVDIRLPDRTAVRLRELLVRPRTATWNVVIGSLWFDTKSGQLVRAAYRFAVPLDIWAMVKEDDPHAMDDVPVWVKPMISPMRGQITAVAIEYGLHEGRFWLPRIRAAEGSAQVSFMHVPFKMEQSFKYASVNALDSLPQIVVAGELRGLDSLPDSVAFRMRDSLRAARRARRDSIRRGLIEEPQRISQCDTSDYRVVTRVEREDGELLLRTATRVPCDVSKLATAPELPPSIFDAGEEIFGSKERDALIKEALSLGAQPPFLLGSGRLPPPTLRWGLEFLRYNRVEGFSAGGQVEQQLGSGYVARGTGRLSTAAFHPDVELTLERTNLERTYALTGYHRLVAASDWGNPLSFGSSLSALLFGRDEGFYYRATGAELTRTRVPRSDGARVAWRLFYEHEQNARQETTWSLGSPFVPNITSRDADYVGTGLHVNHTAGLDPRGLRLLSDVRLEAASALRSSGGENRYARGAADFTISHGLPASLIGAVTLSGGTSVGELPPQRRWYLGGARTVRGQRPDTAAAGNAYWLTRTEVGYDAGGVRPVLFGDIGWTGSRDSLYKSVFGRPMSGVGAGASFMDGLFRFDVARGLYPEKRWRVDMYVEARF